MRDDLTASEKRLTAALDRIDRLIDRAAAGGGGDGALHDSRAENQRLSQELSALHERQSATLATCEARLAEAHQRLVAAGQEAARLAAANEALATANRALVEAAALTPDDALQALQAELDALRAARAAEMAQMGDILDTLDRMAAAPSDAAPATAAVSETADLDGEGAEPWPKSNSRSGTRVTLCPARRARSGC